MTEELDITLVRDSISKADKSTARALELDRIANLVRHGPGLDGETRMTVHLYVKRRLFSFNRPVIQTIDLTKAECEAMTAFLKGYRDAEYRRAQAYENEAVARAKHVSVGYLGQWTDPNKVNPGRINVSLDEFIPDPAKDLR